MTDPRRHFSRLKCALAFLVAPPIPPILFTGTMVRLGVWHAEANWDDWDRWWLMPIDTKIFYSYLGALFFAAPPLFLLHLRGYRNLGYFAVVGGISGLMTETIFDSMDYLSAVHDNRLQLSLHIVGYILDDIWRYPENPVLFALSGTTAVLIYSLVTMSKATATLPA